MHYGQNQYRDPLHISQMTNEQMPGDKRSPKMTTAAIVLSVAAISTTCCLYLSIVCSSLAIIFALLSKGGEQTMSANAKMALRTSVLAIFLTITLTIGSFVTVIREYGSVDAFLKTYMELVQRP